VATHPRVGFQAVRQLSGLSIPAESFSEAASQTFHAGACVFLSAGLLNECGTNPALIMGIAARAGQNGSSGVPKTLVYLAHPDTLFLGNSDTSASEGTGVTAAADVGKMFGVTKHASNGKWYVDSNKVASNKRVIVWKLWDGIVDGVAAAAADVLGQVFFSFDPQFFQGQRTS
jgi:hypothetical protein